MRRREFIAFLGGAAAWPVVVRAQQSRHIPVVGVLWAYPNADAAAPSRLSLLKGFAEFSYIPGKTITLEERYAGDSLKRFDSFAVELVALNANVLVGQASAATYALRRATSTIPIVFVGVGDPVAQGLTASLSRPGGNLSGVSQMAPDLPAKRMQLVWKTIPTLSHVALLRDPTNASADAELSQYVHTTKELGLSYELFDVTTGNDIDQAFQRMADQPFQAVVVFNSNLFFSERRRISALGLRNRLAIVGPSKYFIEAGSLLSYGVDFPTLWHSAAHIIDKILTGERVGDIPIQQPIKFDFCLNLKTAKLLGIEIPPAVLALADEVIE
jgi:putative tryptophan/tyrosine transport system substrate-binding protein